MEVTLHGSHLAGPRTMARRHQDSYLRPLPQQKLSTVALYVDGGLVEEGLTATKCLVASVLAPGLANPDTNDQPGMTFEEESEDKTGPNHLVSVRSFTYQGTHKKFVALVTLDPTPEEVEAQECVCSHIAKIEEGLLSRLTRRLTAPSLCWWRPVGVVSSPPKNLLRLCRWSS